MKKNMIYGILGALILFIESIVASAISTVFDIENPYTYIELLKQPFFWITVIGIVLVEVIVTHRENEKNLEKIDLNLEFGKTGNQSMDITKTECIKRLMKSATEKAINGNFYDAKQTMEIMKELDKILESEGKEYAENKKKDND